LNPVCFFEKICDAFRNININIIVSTSRKFPMKDFSNKLPNIDFHQWVPGREVINKSDLIIFHGGYGTMMETAKAGKPSIVIPFHSEQESNGRRLESNGCGKILKISKQNYSIHMRNWAFGDYSILSQSRIDLQSEELSSTKVWFQYGSSGVPSFSNQLTFSSSSSV